MNRVDERTELSTTTVIALTSAAMLVYFLTLIFVWGATSEETKPANFIDFKVKTPATTEEFLERGSNK